MSEKIKADELGNGCAKLNLAASYCVGRGVEQDYKKAFELALESAENGIVDAMGFLGDFYYYGWGVEKDREKANYWYREENNCKEMLLEYFWKRPANKKENDDMKYDIKTKCRNCGKTFTVREGFLFEIPDGEVVTKEEWEDVAFLHNVRGIKGFCPECRKYEIMIKYKRNWVEDFVKIEDVMKEFAKVGKIKDWKTWIEKVPKQKGVYAVTRSNEETPEFLVVGKGGFFKDKDPNVSIEELSKKWYYSSHKIMYIGRAGLDDDNPKAQRSNATLQERIKKYMRFGNKDKVGHWGGRYIWQLTDSEELDVWFRVRDNPETLESELIEKHKPFANLVKGKLI